MYLQKNLRETFESFNDNSAIEENGKTISYAELLEKSTRISDFLLNRGFGTQSRVGICVDDITDLVLGMLGAILARCVFVPLDASLPEKRFLQIVKQSELDTIIVSGGGYSERKTNSVQHIGLTDIFKERYEHNLSESLNYQENDDLYIYFTSGSTGEPKGIIGKNTSLWHFLKWEIETFNIKPSQRFSQFVSPYFDAFLRDIFVPLMSGGTICVPPRKESLFTSEQLIHWIDEQQISFIHCVPSIFRIFNDKSLSPKSFEKLKYVLLSGERIIPSGLINWYDTFGERIQLVNLYGSTEATMISSYYNIKPEDTLKTKIPIGQPISDSELVIIDKTGALCKPLIVGDLYIVSNYLSNGYLNNPLLTAEKFIKLDKGASGQLAFKTGDRARILTDGSIDLLGREDRLIKLRGMRIELDEIEQVLLKCPFVQNAFVLYDEQLESLVAFVTNDAGDIETKSLIKQIEKHLQESLPAYMIPSRITVVNVIPLLRNGKVDYKQLLKSKETKEVVLPTDEIEKKIHVIWKEILNIDEVSTDTKFHNVGGNSLTIMRLMPRLFSEFGIRISLAELFMNLTIQKQATLIRGKLQDLDDLEIKSETSFRKSSVLSENIEKAPNLSYYTLSSSQKRLYFLNELDSDSLAYNMPQVVKLDGEFDKEKLVEVINKIIIRHESLRTSIVTIEEKPVQIVLQEFKFSIEYFESEEADSKSIIQAFIRPFDLSQAPLIRVGLIKLSAQSHLLIVDMHHIVTDGVSHQLLVKDFMALYNNVKLPALRLQYKDYAEWQQSTRHRERLAHEQEFWKQEFREDVIVLDLPTDFSRPLVKSYAGRNRYFSFNKAEKKKIEALGEEAGATMFMTILSIFNVLLSKLSNQEDITIGTVLAGRHYADLEEIIGVFVNTVALRNYPKSEKSFNEFLSEVKARTLSCFDNQSYPYEELIGELQISRDPGRNPLFDVMFVFQNFKQEELIIPGLKMKPYDSGHTVSKFDLTLIAVESNEGIHFNFEYSTDLFKEETMERFISYFQRIIAEVTGDTDKKLSQINILSEEERHELLHKFDHRVVDYPREKTVIDLFREQVAKNPDKVALVFEQQTLTYRELDQRSDMLGSILRDYGVVRDSVVGLLMDRSINTVIGMLSILKSGGAYLPIDIDYPDERISYLLKDSGASLLLTTSLQSHGTNFPIKTLFLEDQEVIDTNLKKLELINEPSDLCYIIYTSGTTGNPKGVMIEHRNVVRLFVNKSFQFDFGPDDVWTMFHSHTFDFSVWEMYGALLFGGRLVIVPKMVARDTNLYLEMLKSEKITILNQTPSAFYNLINEHFSGSSKSLDLRYVIFGGEALTPAKLRDWKVQYPDTKLVNMFGITETTVHVTYKEITDYDIAHNESGIGMPIPTSSVYLFNEYKELVPQGVKAELYIGGEGVARGYLNNKELTREKFISNPYNPEERLYKSGDMGRMLSNGELEYLGRCDDQVKIRGFRIELGEIESKLAGYFKVKETVVIARGSAGNQYLVGYYVSDEDIDQTELRSYMSAQLPEHMLPAYFVPIESMPLTPNGKVDRKALLDLQVIAREDHVTPSTNIEEKLVEIWSEILEIDKGNISITKSFFDLGGDSIKIMILKNRINHCFHSSFSVASIFSMPTIKSLARILNNSSEATKKTSESQIQEEADLRDKTLNLFGL